MVVAISVEKVFVNGITVVPRKIDIKIGRGYAFLIKKALKIQVKLNRIYIGNTQAIRHGTIGATASAYKIISFRAGKEN